MEKNYNITTAIPYVNGTPHIGNCPRLSFSGYLGRYEKQNGKEVRFQVATDEHGY